MSGSKYGAELPLGLNLPPVDRNANDYSRIESMVGSVEPTLPISVVLPVYNRIDMLRRTMAMLTHQTYPLHLMEVIIADDGSNDQPEQLIEEFSEFFEVNYVRQRDLGYRLSHVRNLGVRSARHDHIIILDIRYRITFAVGHYNRFNKLICNIVIITFLKCIGSLC